MGVPLLKKIVFLRYSRFNQSTQLTQLSMNEPAKDLHLSIKENYIDSCTHPLYEEFQNLYRKSFPIFEQRSAAQQALAFQNEKYRLLAFTGRDSLIGFISYWQFDTYLYIEHFAINTELRGMGYGSRLLRSFIHSTDKLVLLEIDPITDSVSEARLRFYKKCGFHENQHPHKHPAYCKEYAPHSLIILTTGRQISAQEYLGFDSDLKTTVMNFL